MSTDKTNLTTSTATTIKEPDLSDVFDVVSKLQADKLAMTQAAFAGVMVIEDQFGCVNPNGYMIVCGSKLYQQLKSQSEPK